MKISKNIKVEEGIKLSYFDKRDIVKRNVCKQIVYFICTSPCKHWLFEIIEAKDLSVRYNDSYLVGVTKTYKEAVLQVESLVDQIYNKNTLKYKELTS